LPPASSCCCYCQTKQRNFIAHQCDCIRILKTASFETTWPCFACCVHTRPCALGSRARGWSAILPTPARNSRQLAFVCSWLEGSNEQAQQEAFGSFFSMVIRACMLQQAAATQVGCLVRVYSIRGQRQQGPRTIKIRSGNRCLRTKEQEQERGCSGGYAESQGAHLNLKRTPPLPSNTHTHIHTHTHTHAN
jgi:hypothetical protein